MSSAAVKLTMPVAPATSRWATWRDITLASILALGLSTVFLGPGRLYVKNPTPSSGQVLGQSVIVPLTIPVTVRLPEATTRIMTQPQHGTIPEALGQAASTLHGRLSYWSRGGSIYLDSFLDRRDGDGGLWSITVNGRTLTDLSAWSLAQGDDVVIELRAP